MPMSKLRLAARSASLALASMLMFGPLATAGEVKPGLEARLAPLSQEAYVVGQTHLLQGDAGPSDARLWSIQYDDDDYYDDEDDYYEDEEADHPSITDLILGGMNKGYQQTMPVIQDMRRREAEQQAAYDADVQRMLAERRAQDEHNERMMVLQQQAQAQAAQQAREQQRLNQQSQQSAGQKPATGHMEGCSWSAENRIWACN